MKETARKERILMSLYKGDRFLSRIRDITKGIGKQEEPEMPRKKPTNPFSSPYSSYASSNTAEQEMEPTNPFSSSSYTTAEPTFKKGDWVYNTVKKERGMATGRNIYFKNIREWFCVIDVRNKLVDWRAIHCKLATAEEIDGGFKVGDWVFNKLSNRVGKISWVNNDIAGVRYIQGGTPLNSVEATPVFVLRHYSS